ncbi:hypothetical protein D3C86_1938340 [compost metagenome]
MQRAKAKHLRRIRLPDHAAIHGFEHAPMLVDPLESVACRHGQQTAHRIVGQLTEQFIEIITRQIRSCGIVNQHPILIVSALGMQMQQGIEH